MELDRKTEGRQKILDAYLRQLTLTTPKPPPSRLSRMTAWVKGAVWGEKASLISEVLMLRQELAHVHTIAMKMLGEGIPTDNLVPRSSLEAAVRERDQLKAENAKRHTNEAERQAEWERFMALVPKEALESK